MQQQQIEVVDAAALETLLGRHSQVPGVLIRAAQLRVSETLEAFRAAPLAFIKVVTDRANEAVILAREALKSLPDDLIRAASAVRIGGNQGVYPVPGAQQID